VSRRTGRGRLTIGVVVAAVTIAVLSLPVATVVRSEAQPPGVRYDDTGATYHLGLARQRTLGAPVVGGVGYELWVSADAGFDRRHTVAVDPLGADLEQLTTEWTVAGVRVRFGSGHEVFVPAGSFVGS
jgi:hypothetical protein